MPLAFSDPRKRSKADEAQVKRVKPLVKTQYALRLAERMLKEGKEGAAMENLRTARIHLETYRGLMGGAADTKVVELQESISGMLADIKAEGIGDRIRKAWEKTVSWFTKGSGEAVCTPAAEKTDTGKEK